MTEPFTNWRDLSVTRLQGMEHRHPTEQHTDGDLRKPVVLVQVVNGKKIVGVTKGVD